MNHITSNKTSFPCTLKISSGMWKMLKRRYKNNKRFLVGGGLKFLGCPTRDMVKATHTYHGYCYTISIKFTATSRFWIRLGAPINPPPINLKINQPSSPHFRIWKKCLLTSMMYNSNRISFFIIVKFNFTPMGSGNIFLVPTSGEILQVYLNVKLVSMHTSGSHSSYSSDIMDSASFLL